MALDFREAPGTAVQIDGSLGEGGGQILRTSVSLSAITGRAVEIANIRARRSKPGLQAQHLASVRAAAEICGAELSGAALGSQALRFTPGALTPTGSYQFDVGTAGATGLVAQTVLAPMLVLGQKPVSAVIRGGTHVPSSPPADYVEAVYARCLRTMGADVIVDYTRAGFFPKGGGELKVACGGQALSHPVDLTERGRMVRINLFAVTCQLPDHIAARGIEALRKDLRGYGVPVEADVRNREGNNPGAAIVLTVECENGLAGFTSIGERGKPMERVALEALRAFQKWFSSGAAVDEHLADQLVLPACLVAAESRWSTPVVTEHLRTVLEVASRFLPITFTIEEPLDGVGRVSVHGVSL